MVKETLLHERMVQTLVNGMMVPITRRLDSSSLYGDLWEFLGKKGTLVDLSGKAFAKYQATEHDVLVCSFVKSGTNWMLQIAYQIAHKGKGEFEHIHQVVPWPDSGHVPSVSLDEIRVPSPTDLRVIKTHYPMQYVPYNESAKYINLIRDPKDVFVSSYHFIKSSVAGDLMPSVETWLRLYLTPHFIMGDWAKHTASYWAERDKPNIMILTFRELKANSEDYIRQIADFMGVSLSEAEFADVLEKSSFDYMKQNGFRFDPPVKPPWLKQKGQLIRRGKSGASSELLTIEQQRAIDAYMQAELTRLGCDFPYTEFFDLA